MTTPNRQDILFLIKNLSNSDSLLEMLMEFEKTMEMSGVFAYKNWEMGELVDGPHIDRFWFTTTWMWPRKLMPDPRGGMRLLKYDCKVQYGKSTYVEPVRVLDPRRDLEPDAKQNKKAKVKRIPVWLVTISMPRRFVDDSYEGFFSFGGEEVDIADIHAAWDEELGDIKQKDNQKSTDEEFSDETGLGDEGI